MPYEDREGRHDVLKEMLGSIGEKVSVGSPFVCDYGCIHIGNNVSINTGYICSVTIFCPNKPPANMKWQVCI